MAKRDFYEILGVSKTADEKELKSAFRKLAKQCHPDASPGDSAAEHKFKEINEAYEILKDPQRRAAYDRFGHAAFEGGGRGPGHGFGPEFNSSMSDIFEDLFGEFMGGGRRQRRGSGAARGADLRYNMEISLSEAFAGKHGADPRAHRPALRGLFRHRRQAGLDTQDVRHLRRFGIVQVDRRASSPSSAPARPAAVSAAPSPIPAPPAPARGASPRSAPCRSTSRRASRTAPASAWRARARRACAAARRAISTSSCRSVRTNSSSATARTCSAACPSR